MYNYPMVSAPKERGWDMVEFALILVLVAVVRIAVLLILDQISGNAFSKINSTLAVQ